LRLRKEGSYDFVGGPIGGLGMSNGKVIKGRGKGKKSIFSLAQDKVAFEVEKWKQIFIEGILRAMNIARGCDP
jgi:hypothetical protein